jgi:hypothetical protein
LFGFAVISESYPLWLPAGTYQFANCPEGGSATTYAVQWKNAVTDASLVMDYGPSGTNTNKTFTEDVPLRANIRISAGCVCNNLKFNMHILKVNNLNVDGIGYTQYYPFEGNSVTITEADKGSLIYGLQTFANNTEVDCLSNASVTVNYSLISEKEQEEKLVNEISAKIITHYVDKYVSFYGDSITTFSGYIPEGNVSEYSGSSLGVSDVNDTWWKRTLDTLGMKLLVNNSWSGRCVTTVRDTSESHLNSAGCRMENIQILKTDERDPDIIIVKLGVNDFLRIGSVTLGSYDGTTEVPTEPSTDFANAYALMLNNIRTAFPNAELWCCTINQMSRKAFPNVVGGVSLYAINDVIIKLASIWGAKVIRHDECGITVFNGEAVFGDYANNMGLHPNATGHKMLADTTIRTMISK